MNRCKNCKYQFSKKVGDVSYCGKVQNNGEPYSYDYWLPKSLLNETGSCKYYVLKWWKSLLFLHNWDSA